MRTGYSIDVGWLITQGEADAATHFRTLQGIMAMQKTGSLLLFDNECHILREYERCLPEDSLGRKIYMHAIKSNMIGYYSGKPVRTCSQCLETIRFDPSDRPYVCVAANADGAYVTHESKHLMPEICAAVLSGCGVQILGSEEFFAEVVDE